MCGKHAFTAIQTGILTNSRWLQASGLRPQLRDGTQEDGTWGVGTRMAWLHPGYWTVNVWTLTRVENAC